MNISNTFSTSHSQADIFTDLNGVEKIKYEEDKDVAIKKVAQQFEALFVQMMLKGMRKTNAVFEEGNFLNSSESQYFRDLHDQQLSLSLSHGNGIGIAEVLYRQLSGNETSTALPTDQEYTIAELRKIDTPISTVNENSFHSLESIKVNKKVTTSREVEEGHASTQAAERIAIADSPSEFVKMIESSAQKAANKLGVDKNLLMAQAALETGWGKYILADKSGQSSNNLFNIKASRDWNGEKISVKSLEFINNTFKPLQSSFRSYANISQSFDDYTNFILNNQRYEKAVKSAADPENFIESIHKAGYATDPDYSKKVLEIFKRISNLTQISDTSDKRGPRS